MTYHNDQFFRLNSANSGESSAFHNNGNNGAGWALINADNPHFIYPDRTIRTEGPDGPRIEYLKRGYIRSLSSYTGNGESLDIRKCQFQFNPATLTQSVESAQSTLNFAQMDPGQYAVPRSTSVNFTFDLLFDRSMEINNASDEVPADGVNPWQLGDPGQVGVLRDLAAFFGVIGQSIDPSQVAYMEQSVIESLRAEASTSTSETAAADLQKAIANAPGFIQANAANSAFLLPTPVRILFSSLYVVEGFVTNTTVTMTKFNTAMVPMQCALSVTMEAKYIGFAQKNTFLNWSLEQRQNLVVAEEKAAAAAITSVYDSFSAMGATAELGSLYYELDAGASSTQTLSQLLGGPSASRSIVYGKMPVAASKSRDSDPVVSLFDDTTDSLSAIMGGQLFIYGPFDDLSFYQTQTMANIAHMVRSSNAPTVFQGMLTTPGYNCVATSSTGWRNLVDGCSSHPADNLDPVGLYRSSATYNSAKWYVLQASVDMSVRSNSVSTQGHGTAWRVIPPSSGSWVVSQVVSLDWPTSPSASVPTDNAATSPPSSGSVSTIGQGPR